MPKSKNIYNKVDKATADLKIQIYSEYEKLEAVYKNNSGVWAKVHTNMDDK